MAGKRALTLVEIMIVTLISILLVIGVVDMFVSTQRTAHHGLDRLESLTTARLVLEMAARDLKLYCFNDTIDMDITQNGAVKTWTFPIFSGRPVPEMGFNPVNRVAYIYDQQAQTVTRKLLIHPRLVGHDQPTDHIIGRDVAAFSIQQRTMFGFPIYTIEIKIQTPHPLRQKTAVHLRTEVRSEFEIRLYRHRNQISNYFSPPAIHRN